MERPGKCLLAYFIVTFVVLISVESAPVSATERLALNFYVNLQKRHEWLSKNASYNKDAIDEEISEFENLMREGKSKRYARQTYDSSPNSHRDIDAETFSFRAFDEIGFLKTRRSKNLAIFQHKGFETEPKWCALVIAEHLRRPDENLLAIYRFAEKTNSWEALSSIPIPPSTTIRTIPAHDGTLAVVGRNTPKDFKLHDGLTISTLNANYKLDVVQTLETALFSNVQLWKNDGRIFLSIANDRSITKDGVHYENENPIYEWKGNHFDVLQYFATKSAKWIEPFRIGPSGYFAVANHENDYGEVSIYSEIYKYEPDQEKYVPFQKIATRGAISIHSFGFQWKSYGDSYLIVVDSPRLSHKDHTSSVVYKFERGKFMPFQKLPGVDIVEWFSLIDDYEKFVLVGISRTNDLKVLQYNGWLFEEVNYNVQDLHLSNGVVEIKNFVLFDGPVLAVTRAYEEESTTTFYKPNFQPINSLKDVKIKVNDWCRVMREKIEYSDEKYLKSTNSVELLKAIRQKIASKIPKRKDSVSLKDITIPRLKTKAVYADDFYLNHQTIQNINNLIRSFYSQLVSIRSLREVIPSSLNDKNTIAVNSIKIKKLHLACDLHPCKLLNVSLNKLNTKNMKYFQKETLYINNGFAEYNKIILDTLYAKNKLLVDHVNKKDVNHYRKMILSKAEKIGVSIYKTLVLNKGISFSGKFANVRLNDENVLLNNRNQRLKGHFFIPRIKSAILEVEQVNDLRIAALNESINNSNRTISSFKNVPKINADDIFAQSTNAIEIETIHSSALKLDKEQNISGNFKVKNMQTNRILINETSKNGFSPANLVTVNGGSFKISQDLHFGEIVCDELTVDRRLNNINVNRGGLDVLLLNTTVEQRLIGDKTFENVELMGPINLVGRINKGSLERKNPISMIEEPIVLTGDYTITGTVSVETRLLCENLANSADDRSIRQFQQGLKLSESKIDIPIFFSQPLTARHINCDTVNDVDPSSWIITNVEAENAISGRKIFINDLQIDGECSIEDAIDNIRPEVFDNILTVSDEQTIEGRMFIRNISARRMNCGDVLFGEKSLGSLLTSHKTFLIPNTTAVVSFATVQKDIIANQLELSGTVSGLNLNEMFSDTIVDYGDTVVMDYAKMKDLTIIDLDETTKIPSTELDNAMASMYWSKRVNIQGPIYIEYLSNVKQLEFGVSMDGISQPDFGSTWLTTKGDQIIYGKFEFDSLNSVNGIVVDSGEINGKNIDDLFENALWKNENMNVGNIVFEGPQVIMSEVKLDGFLNDFISPSDFVLNGLREYNFKLKTIKKNVLVKNKIYSNFVSGTSLENYCEIFNAKAMKTSWIIGGNIYMQREPIVKKINNIPITEFYDAWYKDANSIIRYPNYFDKVVFKAGIIYNGLLNGIDFAKIRDNYLSLSSDQPLSKSFEIAEIYAERLISKMGISAQYIGGLDMKSFRESILLQDYNQVIKHPVVFESVSGHFDIFGKVNGMNLRDDMMRLSSEGKIIKGKKYLNGNIKTVDLFARNVQGIDVDMWMKDAVTTRAGGKMLKDTKTFKIAHIVNMKTMGTVNDNPPEYLLANDYPQIIQKKTVFLSKPLIRNATFGQNINGIQMNRLDKLVRRTKSSIIQAPKVITSSFYANNVFVLQSINDFPLKELWNSITFNELNDFENLRFNDLMKYSANAFKMNLRAPKYVMDLEEVQFISGPIIDLVSLENDSTGNSKLAIAMENEAGYSEMHFFQWRSDVSRYVKDDKLLSLYFNERIMKLFSTSAGIFTILYVETVRLGNYNRNEYNGYVYTITPNSEMKESRLLNRETLSITKITMRGRICILAMFLADPARIFCMESYGLRYRRAMNISGVLEIRATSVRNDAFLISNERHSIRIYEIVGDFEGLSLVQILPPAMTISTLDGSEDGTFAAAHNGRTLIYRFNADRRSFLPINHINTLGIVRKIDLIDTYDSMPPVHLLIEGPKGVQSQLHTFEGLAGYKLEYVSDFPAPSVKSSIVVRDDRVCSLCVVLKNGVLVQRIDLA